MMGDAPSNAAPEQKWKLWIYTGGEPLILGEIYDMLAYASARVG